MSSSNGGQPTDLTGAIAALASLNAWEDGRVSGVVLAAQSAGAPAVITQLQPTQAAGTPLNALVQQTIRRYTFCEVIDYQPTGSPADGQVMWIDTSAVPLLKHVLEESDDLANLARFDPRHQSLAEMRLTAMRVESSSATAVFVQALRGNQVIAQSTKVGVLVRRGVLDVPNGDLLILTSDVTAVLTGNYVFFRNRSAFQQLTGLLEALRQQAATTFQAVTANLHIEGIEQMATAVVGAPAMLGKMASIQRKVDRYPQYREALTMPKLVAFVLQHPECDVEVTGEGDNAKLVFRNDAQHRFKILKLLDDDYLKSELTTLEYEANSKSAPLGAAP